MKKCARFDHQINLREHMKHLLYYKICWKFGHTWPIFIYFVETNWIYLVHDRIKMTTSIDKHTLCVYTIY